MRFTFDGVQIAARPGETLAAALIRAGRPAGYFCGIGVCFGCLVTVDGVAAQRACLTPVPDGAVVHRDPMLHRATPPGDAAGSAG
jgi:NADH dehydrogenase/NADH:ubiquinone oxidoreductase subunit G